MKIRVHTEFRHDCSDFPEGFNRPGTFSVGDYEVPDEIGDYFIRAGWAAKRGKKPIKPDPYKPVFVKPDNAVHETRTVKKRRKPRG